MHHELRARVPQRSALIIALVTSMLVGSGAAVALASDCGALGGNLVAGECQITTAVTASDSAHGGPFTLDETLHITSSGSITIPPRGGRQQPDPQDHRRSRDGRAHGRGLADRG
jgi:hypothetical protein